MAVTLSFGESVRGDGCTHKALSCEAKGQDKKVCIRTR